MAIERKDRSFDRIFDEVSLDTIPIDYLKSIMLVLIDGTEVELHREDLEFLGSNSQEDLISKLAREDVVDIAIQLDYDLIKNDVTKNVNAILDTLFKDE
jgi:hypothetical protein